ncbi:hypothetical protein QWJ07_23510 [Frankia sp. RB7]|nr:hypothetical protein [Frankia sp. RB7]
MAELRLDEATETAFARARERSRKSIEAEAASQLGPIRDRAVIPADHVVVVVVVRTDPIATAGHKLKDIIAPLKSVMDVPLPLIRTPPLAEVGRQLLSEFPYAAGVIDFVLSDLIARPTVGFRPLLMVGRDRRYPARQGHGQSLDRPPDPE